MGFETTCSLYNLHFIQFFKKSKWYNENLSYLCTCLFCLFARIVSVWYIVMTVPNLDHISIHIVLLFLQ